jgi:hypothetical protein
MNSFLHFVAADLAARYGSGIDALELVFPSRRSQLYFEDYLAQILPSAAPQVTSIKNIFAQISLLSQADHYHLIAMLQRIYSDCLQKNEPFEQFFMWGEMLLADFDSIDKYMVDAEKLFFGLHYHRQLDYDFSFFNDEQKELMHRFWEHFDADKNTGVRGSFLSLWQSLWAVYQRFTTELLQQNLAYEGLLQRHACGILANGGYDFENRHFVVIGLNALNECEKVLMHHLKHNGRADFYWDYDNYYVQDKQQEAGEFMRYNLSHFPPAAQMPADNFAQCKDIQIVSAPTDALQTKLLPQMIDEIRGTQPLSALDRSTAIVLIDEGLLIPALYALPVKKCENDDGLTLFNVTMGYPLRQTPIYGLMELLRQLHKNMRITTTESAFYHKDVIAILQHQYVKSLWNNEITIIVDNIIEHNRIYLNSAFLAELPQEIRGLFNEHGSSAEFCEELCNFLTYINEQKKLHAPSENILHQEYINYTIKEINKLSHAMLHNSLMLSIPAFMALLCSSLKNVKIPFEGDPIEGLQIMGILETHAIDFQQLIVLSLNEDTFSYKSAMASFIPYALRRAYKMPVLEQYDALYAYYFYRLLQRASSVRLLYSSQTEAMRSGEQSRYLRQLIAESPHQPRVRAVQYNIGFGRHAPIVVAKNGDVMALLRDFLTGGGSAFSATSLQKYMACPLQFYFANIAKIRTPPEIAEDIDARMLGDIFHHAMQKLYGGLLLKNVNENDFRILLNNHKALETIALQQTAMQYFGSEHEIDAVNNNGKLWLTAQIVLKYVKGTLQYDMRRIADSPFVINGLEYDAEFYVKFNLNGNEQQAHVKGRIDRIDETAHGTKVVVDYKSGWFEDKSLMLASVEALFGDAQQQRKEIFQGMLYALMLRESKGAEQIMPAFYFLRNIYDENFDCAIKYDGAPLTNAVPLLPQFCEGMQALLADIFNHELPFAQTNNHETCEQCEFAHICGR